MKFRVTKIAAYVYTRRGTLSLCWRYRMPWWPIDRTHDSGGWFFGAGRFAVEWLAFDEDDPWGERRYEDIVDVWETIASDITKEGDV